MTYKRKYISKKNKLVPGRPLITEKNPSKERKIRHIRMSDEEWNFATENARKVEEGLSQVSSAQHFSMTVCLCTSLRFFRS